MLKIAIWPSFINQSLFELKEDMGQWTLILTKESYPHLKDRGHIWSQQNIPAQIAERLVDLAEAIIKEPASDERLILDGVSVTLRLEVKDKEVKHRFRCPLPGSQEFDFTASLLNLAQTSISDHRCQDYLELLEPYFFEVSPFKEFPETPYRLKIIGGLSTSHQKEFEAKLHHISLQEQPILDMSNFLTTGRALDPYFLALEKVSGLRVWVNENAQAYLQEIGFDPEKMKPRPKSPTN